jgi:monoamine oxidase
MQNIRVLVIGAGASGISAASRLIEKGFKNVTILEAENRIGGRIFTTAFADNVVDLGAQWYY